MFDLAIAGGGPAGSLLALLAGRAGYRVGLFEASRFPREKPCGEGLMPAGVAVLERHRLGAALEHGRPFRGVRYRAGPARLSAAFEASALAPGHGVGIRRLVLDAALFEAAAATPGVCAFAGVRVSGWRFDARGHVTGLETERGLARARLSVAADGARSRLRAALGPPPPRAAGRAGLRQHFRLAAGREAPPWVEVRFDLARGTELYLTPLPEGLVQVAVLMRPEPGGGLRARHAAALAADDFDGLLAGATPLGPALGRSPLASGPLPAVPPGALLLGDAAGTTDPITGAGMSQALQSAEALARHLGALLDGPAPAAREAFEHERRRLLREARLTSGLALALARHPALARAAFGALARTPGAFGYLVALGAGTRRLF